jgi:hypothetical protein
MFVGRRGGARFRIRALEDYVGVTPINRIYVKCRTSNNVTYQALIVGNTASAGMVSSGVLNEVVDTKYEERADFLVHDTCTRSFTPNMGTNLYTTWGDYTKVAFDVTCNVASAAATPYAVSKAIDEDFSFIGFEGSPNFYV